jgi:N-acetylneuraminic acid mutarotase
MIQVRAYHAATRLSDGSVLVAGGHTANGFLSSAELYSPSSRSWTATGGMLAARSDLTATPLSDGRVLVAGGQGAGDATLAYTPLASAELYDLTSGSWTPTGNMIEARASHTATALADGRVLVAGGLNASSGSLASAELYDPATGRWTPTGNMIEARASHTATLLPDGSVLVAGGVAMGSDGDILLASAELYDPNTGSWTASGSMMEPRYFHTATALADGRVLVAGGLNLGSSSKSLASAELYDPRSGSWTAAGDMIQARYWHTAALLVDGKVLIAGGESDIGIGNRLASAELYDPSTGSWTATAAMLYRCAITQTATLLPDGTVLVVGCGSVDAVAAQLYEPGTAPETQH